MRALDVWMMRLEKQLCDYRMQETESREWMRNQDQKTTEDWRQEDKNKRKYMTLDDPLKY